MKVYDFLDYRDVISAFLAENPRISMRELARRLGCSVSWISQILRRKRELDPAIVPDLCDIMGLGPAETEYFESLLALESPVDASQQAAWTRVSAARRMAGSESVRDDAVRLFSEWIWGAVWQLSLCAGFSSDAKWIARTLIPQVSEHEARDAVDGLLSLGLLEVVDGKVVGVSEDRHSPLSVPRGAYSEAVASWHRHHLANVAARMKDTAPPLRLQLGMTLAIPESQVGHLHQLVSTAVMETMAAAETLPGPKSRVVHVVVAMVPVSTWTGTREERST